MSYRLLDHTGDLGIQTRAATLDGLFVECLRAQTDCLTRLDRVEPRQSRKVSLTAPELPMLLVDFLSELIYLYETQGLVFANGELEIAEKAGKWSLDGRVTGETFEIERHGLKTLLKAVTYHRLVVRPTTAGWQARVIFDI